MAIAANHHRFFAVTKLVARSTNRGDTEADQEDHRCAADPQPGLHRVRQRLAGVRLPRDANGARSWIVEIARTAAAAVSGRGASRSGRFRC